MANICFVCEKKVTWHDDYEWFGLDGDKIHKKCVPKVEAKMDMINNMSNAQFSMWMRGADIEDLQGENQNE